MNINHVVIDGIDVSFTNNTPGNREIMAYFTFNGNPCNYFRGSVNNPGDENHPTRDIARRAFEAYDAAQQLAKPEPAKKQVSKTELRKRLHKAIRERDSLKARTRTLQGIVGKQRKTIANLRAELERTYKVAEEFGDMYYAMEAKFGKLEQEGGA